MTGRSSTFVLCAAASIAVACRTPGPETSMALAGETLEQRVLETRQFDTPDDVRVLQAVLTVLQDEGYQLDEMDAELGVLIGSRPTGGPLSEASVVARPVGDPPRAVSVRVTFQGMHTTTRAGTLGLPQFTWAMARCDDADVYRLFFERLSRAVSLEARSP